MGIDRGYLPLAGVLVATVVPLPLPLHGAQRQRHGPAAAHRHAHGHVRVHRRVHGAAADHRRARVIPPVAHAAADLSVTIADFRFTPATLTIHAGDTVTWTNQGPSAHTATARDGSFDTGLLRKGQSASHTFTQPGTISYFCRVHPFMRGTIVVLPVAAKSTSPAPRARAGARAGAGGNASPAASGSAPSKRAALPMTGADIGLLALLGLILGGLGAGLRRVLHHH